MQNITDERFLTIYQCTEIDLPNWTSKCTEVVHPMYRSFFGHVPM